MDVATLVPIPCVRAIVSEGKEEEKMPSWYTKRMLQVCLKQLTEEREKLTNGQKEKL